jgi:tetratricopeptide (TPR) repeat protein
VSKHAPDKDAAFHQALQKANKFLARKNFALAKKEFEAAMRIEPGETLREKICLCSDEMARQNRKEAVKRGRKLDKKGRYAEALQCFERAAAQEAEAWLDAKIAELRTKLALSEASTLLAGAEESVDLEARLAVYDKVLAISPTEELLQKKAQCLVKLGRFEEALVVYGAQQPSGDMGRYSFGYAYAKTGRYLQALEQWGHIRRKDRRLLAQVESLLPLVCRELEVKGQGYAIPWEILQAVPDTERSPLLTNYEGYFKCKYIEELWTRGEYEEMLPLLLPEKGAMSLDSLALHAKLYFKLAEREIRHLEPAISFWLTAVYNDQILESLHIKRLMGESLDNRAIRESLLQSMERLVERYAREGLLSERLRVFWETEARIIRRVSTRSLTAPPLDLFPCTPAFASQFSLASQVLQSLEERRQAATGEAEESIEARAYFSQAGRSLMLIEMGEEDEALSLIPKVPRDELEAYCRQRVLLGYGMKKAREGTQQLKMYFLEALPLLEQYPRYADAIIELVYAEEDVKSYVGLAEAMELLSEHLHRPRFREATAHAMSIKALELLHTKVNPVLAEKLLEKALRICPDSHLARSTLADVKRRMALDELAKAFKRQNLSKAVNVVNRDRDPRLVDYFFETMENWFESVRDWEPVEKLGALREFYASCRLVDKEQPLIIKLSAEIRRLEEK